MQRSVFTTLLFVTELNPVAAAAAAAAAKLLTAVTNE
jgi:hypothetical protein